MILAPLPIGFAVFLVHLATIPITGTGINPARSLRAAIIYNKSHAWDDHWIFWVGPFIGAAVAAMYRVPELLELLDSHRPIGVVVYRVPELESDQLVKISLRSMDKEDTTPISQEFGGGGHRNVRSFMLSSSEFEGWKVSKGEQGGIAATLQEL